MSKMAQNTHNLTTKADGEGGPFDKDCEGKNKICDGLTTFFDEIDGFRNIVHKSYAFSPFRS